MKIDGKRLGFAMTGSFCTFQTSLACLEEILAQGACVTPILSYAADTMDTRFITAKALKNTLLEMTKNEVIRTIPQAEPIGPQKLLDILLVLPATGNTLAKLSNGITDTPVTMAVKSHLRNNKPVVLGVSTNDALGNSAANIGRLLNAKNIYFVPFGQDDPFTKPRSMVFRREWVVKTVEEALDGKQIQPLLLGMAT